MLVVYRLTDELQRDPEQVRQAAELSLDANRPDVGLRGSRGLFGTQEWWASIECGLIPIETVAGTITQVYRVGQDPGSKPNEMAIARDDGGLLHEGLYANDKQSLQEYRPARRVEIDYALDDLKMGGKLPIVIEVRIGDCERS